MCRPTQRDARIVCPTDLRGMYRPKRPRPVPGCQWRPGRRLPISGLFGPFCLVRRQESKCAAKPAWALALVHGA